MPVELDLGQADQEVFRIILEALSSKSRFRQSFDDLINGWSAMIEMTDRGYPASIYEYTNDLGFRDQLAKIYVALSEDGQRELAKTLNYLDKRFEAATVPVPNAIRGKPPGLPGWWWFRIPKNVSAELKTDLMKEGII